MKRSNAELAVGGVIFIALVILIAGVLWLKEYSVSRKSVEYSVIFPNIGTLQNGDPVTVNGIRLGSVGAISLHGTQVAVIIKLDKTVTLTDSSKVTIQNIGLMGERKVEISLSDKGIPYLPNSSDRPSVYIQGRFDSGIAEAMGQLGTVLAEATTLVDTVQVILDRTVGDSSFVRFFKSVTHRLDTVVYLAQNLVATNSGDINTTVDDLHAAVSDVRTLIDQNKGNINKISNNGTKISEEAILLVDRVDSISATLKVMIDDIDQGKNALGKVMKDTAIVQDLKTTVADIDTLVRDIQDDGLKLRLKLFGGKPEKRKTNP